jgi:hypothetical protein
MPLQGIGCSEIFSGIGGDMTTIYEVIRRPLITEKSNYQSNKLNQYAFEVANEARQRRWSKMPSRPCLT